MKNNVNKIILLLFCLFFAKTGQADWIDQMPYYYAAGAITNIIKVKILDAKITPNIINCKNGEIINRASDCEYKCKIIKNYFGKMDSSILTVFFKEVDLGFYDSNCRYYPDYSYAVCYNGIESNLKKGQEYILYLHNKKVNSNINNDFQHNDTSEISQIIDSFKILFDENIKYQPDIKITAAIEKKHFNKGDKFIIKYFDCFKLYAKYKNGFAKFTYIGLNKKNNELILTNSYSTIYIINKRLRTIKIIEVQEELKLKNYLYKVNIEKDKIHFFTKKTGKLIFTIISEKIFTEKDIDEINL